jgi:hypothetical protein
MPYIQGEETIYFLYRLEATPTAQRVTLCPWRSHLTALFPLGIILFPSKKDSEINQSKTITPRARARKKKVPTLTHIRVLPTYSKERTRHQGRTNTAARELEPK